MSEKKAAPTTVCRTILGDSIAKPFREELTKSISELGDKRKPKLLGILGTDSAPSHAYAEWTAKGCEAIGIEYELRDIYKESGGMDSPGKMEEAILQANNDDSINGIIVYYPIFGPKQDAYLQQLVDPLKDVEGLHMVWLFNLYHNRRTFDLRKVTSMRSGLPVQLESTDDEQWRGKAILPCTPLALVKTIEHCRVYNPLLPYGSRAYGKVITVINRSEVVGRPLAALLANDGARVFSVDIDSIEEFSRRPKDSDSESNSEASSQSSFLPQHISRPTNMTLKECLAISDVVVSGVPSASYKIPTSDLKDGVVAINFSESKNFEPSIKEKASIYVPAVGKVTIAMLQRNLLRLYGLQDRVRAATEAASESKSAAVSNSTSNSQSS